MHHDRIDKAQKVSEISQVHVRIHEVLLRVIINARSVTILTLCVCPPFSGSIKRLYNTLITEIVFLLNAKDFQLKDFSEKASFESYSLFCLFYGMAAIYFVNMLTQHIDARFCKSVLL